MDASQVPELVTMILVHLDMRHLAIAAAVCRVWYRVSHSLRYERTQKLKARALEWIAANSGNAVLAGSLPLFFYMEEKYERPTWYPNNADVFVLPVVGKSRFRLKSPGGGFLLSDIVVQSARSMRFPELHRYGQINVIYPGVDFFKLFYWNQPFARQTLLDTFDFTGCMIGMIENGNFIFGERFSVDAPIVYMHIESHLYYEPEAARANIVFRKYRQRGFQLESIRGGRSRHGVWRANNKWLLRI